MLTAARMSAKEFFEGLKDLMRYSPITASSGVEVENCRIKELQAGHGSVILNLRFWALRRRLRREILIVTGQDGLIGEAEIYAGVEDIRGPNRKQKRGLGPSLFRAMGRVKKVPLGTMME